MTDSEIKESGEIKIIPHVIDQNILSKIKYEELNWTETEDPTRMLDLLWLTSWSFRQPRPEWQGAMQAAMVADHPGKAEVVFLPMIDLSASD